ncbi:hypothetical protein DVDV_2806 [Desulfovibrio sp. DV]|nr:hypothetical protein DVDV_2806 [Desulfovibrio sp. DV]
MRLYGPRARVLESAECIKAGGIDLWQPFDEGPVLPRLFLDLLFECLAMADVNIDAEPGLGLALLIHDRHPTAEEGVFPAVRACDLVLPFPYLHGVEGALPVGDGVLHFLGRQPGDPVEVAGIVKRDASHFHIGIAQVGNIALGVARPYAERNEIPEDLVALFGLGQVRLSLSELFTGAAELFKPCGGFLAGLGKILLRFLASGIPLVTPFRRLTPI